MHVSATHAPLAQALAQVSTTDSPVPLELHCTICKPSQRTDPGGVQLSCWQNAPPLPVVTQTLLGSVLVQLLVTTAEPSGLQV